MNAGSTKLGLVEHLAGALAFLIALSLGPRVIGSLLSILSSAFVKRGSFVVIGPIEWQSGGPYWGLHCVVAIVGGAAVALDHVLSRSNHRALIPPLVVGGSVAVMTLVVPPLHDDGSTPIASGIVFGMAASAMFSVWWFTALGVARLRRSALPVGRA